MKRKPATRTFFVKKCPKCNSTDVYLAGTAGSEYIIKCCQCKFEIKNKDSHSMQNEWNNQFTTTGG